MNELLEQFLVESRELVEQAMDDLGGLERDPDDRARLDSAFRAFHTLKGGAGIIEFAAMGRALHAAEDLLAAARSGDSPLTADRIRHAVACLDQISRWLEAIETDGAPPADADGAADDLVRRFAPFEAAHAAEPTLPAGQPAWLDPMLARSPASAGARTAVRYTPAPECFFRGEDPLALMAGLPGLLALDLRPRQPWPALAELDTFACNLVVDALTSATPEEVEVHLRAVRREVEIHALAPHARAGGAGLPVRAAEILRAQAALASGPAGDGFAGRLASAGRVAGNVLRHLGMGSIAGEIEASLAAAGPGAFLAALEAILSPPAVPEPDMPPVAMTGRDHVIARALRVDVERIDAIVRLAGELTVAKNALGHAARLAAAGSDPKALAAALKQQHAQLDRLTAALQRSVLAIRVLPLRHVFQRFPRLVREMAGSLGKAARLAIDGETTEADKAIVEALFEPLLHVLRNAVGHGIESAEERARAGKPRIGSIRLGGRRDGEHVIVEISDDGGGVDLDAVRRVAAARSLAPAEALATFPEEDILELLFAPGFSTADSVTSLSGRGVGMDAVRTAIARLGGRVDLRSRSGNGTTVRFTLPFTVMMTRVATVEAGGQVFGVPFEAIVETLQLRRADILPIGAAEAFVLRGRTVPLVSLSRALGLEPGGPAPPVANAVVIEAGGQLGALEVDRFGERLDVMLTPMAGLLAGMRGVAGTTLLGDGRVLIVLDLEELLR